MVVQRPLVIVSGDFSELPPGDTPADVSVGSLTAGSGLIGGGDLATAVTVNVSLAPNPSGLILVGTGGSAKLADDGVAQRLADDALASGNFALSASEAAIASGVEATVLSEAAIASGAAAINIINNLPVGTLVTYEAGSAVASGSPVGVNAAGYVESIRETVNPYSILTPDNNFFPYGSGLTTENIGLAYLPSADRFVICYEDDQIGSYLVATVGEVAGNTITYGNPSRIGTTIDPNWTVAETHLAEDRIVVAYQNITASSYLNANAISVNPLSNTVSVGTTVVLSSVISTYIDLTYDSTNEKIIYTYTENTDGNTIAGFVTLSGSNIFAGDSVTVSTLANVFNRCEYDPINDASLVIYRGRNGGLIGRGVSVSGAKLNIVTPEIDLIPQDSEYPYLGGYIPGEITYVDQAQKYLLSYNLVLGGPANQLGARVVEFSGSTLAAYNDTPIITGVNSNYYFGQTYNPVTNSVAIATNTETSGFIHAVQIDPVNNVVKTLPTSFCYGSGWTASGEDIDSVYPRLIYASGSDKVVLAAYMQLTHTFTLNSGCGVLFDMNQQYTLPLNNDQSTNFVGIAQQTVNSGDSVLVRLPGSIDRSNTGLSPGAVYYVDPTTSGFKVSSSEPSTWSGVWAPVGRATTSSSLLLTDSL